MATTQLAFLKNCKHNSRGQYSLGNSTGGTGVAGFVIKLGKVGCVSHVYSIAYPWKFELKCLKIGVLDRPENVHRKQVFFQESKFR